MSALQVVQVAGAKEEDQLLSLGAEEPIMSIRTKLFPNRFPTSRHVSTEGSNLRICTTRYKAEAQQPLSRADTRLLRCDVMRCAGVQYMLYHRSKHWNTLSVHRLLGDKVTTIRWSYQKLKPEEVHLRVIILDVVRWLSWTFRLR